MACFRNPESECLMTVGPIHSMASGMVVVDGENLTIRDLFETAEGRTDVELSDSARIRMERSRENLERMIGEGRRLYGINTGFGRLQDTDIRREDMISLQKNLIRSHSSNVGRALSERHTRAMMLVRANTLCKGFSGVRPAIVESIISALNRRLHPYVPALGSVGASGDLSPLAHVALSLIGEGKVITENGVEDSAEVLRREGLPKLDLLEKEGVAFINGTSTITGILGYELYRSFRLLNAAMVSFIFSFLSLRGNPAAFTDWAVSTRPHEGQRKIARLINETLGKIGYRPANLQDPYSLRCTPQVFGAVLDTFNYVRSVVEVEMNSVTDNPIVGEDDVISSGNFHGEPVALASDFLAIALTDLGNLIERRVARLVDPGLSGLPAFLTEHHGIQSGYMIPQYTAAALCNYNKILSHPASSDSIPTSANQEDHVSMGTNSAIKLSQIVDNLYDIVSIELLLSVQALDLSGIKPPESLQGFYSSFRKYVKKLEDDRPPYEDLQRIREQLLYGELGHLCDSLFMLNNTEV